MQRVRIDPRPDWRERVEEVGLYWAVAEDGRPYWDESAYWLFEADEIDRIEAATDELYAMVLEAVDRVVAGKQLAAFGYDASSAALITDSWGRRDWEPTFYARFDLAYDGTDLKLLELNGDTPTSLLEAAAVQWWWLQDRFPDLDQFNSVHEKLLDALRLYARHAPPGPLHFTCVAPHAEDEGTVGYLAACAAEAGLRPVFVPLDQIGWAEGLGFVDLDEAPITALFKLAPWEHLLADPFGRDLAAEVGQGRLKLIEPAWKMLASNKRLLVTLKEMFPDSDLLLEASTSAAEAAEWGDYVRKPVLGREGANVTLFHTQEGGVPEIRARQAGGYGDDLFVYQRRAALAEADGNYAVLGSWVVNRVACGLGVRESTDPITSNTARFVPHVLR